jgi:hypothetical protein
VRIPYKKRKASCPAEEVNETSQEPAVPNVLHQNLGLVTVVFILRFFYKYVLFLKNIKLILMIFFYNFDVFFLKIKLF